MCAWTSVDALQQPQPLTWPPVVLCAEGAVVRSGSAGTSGAAGTRAPAAIPSQLRCTSVCCSGSSCGEELARCTVRGFRLQGACNGN